MEFHDACIRCSARELNEPRRAKFIRDAKSIRNAKSIRGAKSIRNAKSIRDDVRTRKKAGLFQRVP